MPTANVIVRQRVGQATFARWRDANGAERVEEVSPGAVAPGDVSSGWTCVETTAGWKYDTESGRLGAGDIFPGDEADPMAVYYETDHRVRALMPGQFTLAGAVLTYDPQSALFEVR